MDGNRDKNSTKRQKNDNNENMENDNKQMESMEYTASSMHTLSLQNMQLNVDKKAMRKRMK